jgi:predicted membrane protein
MTNSRIIWAIALIMIGLVAIAVRADLLDWPFRFIFRNLFSIGLIALGIYLIIRQLNRPKMTDPAGHSELLEPYAPGFQTFEKAFGDLHFDARDTDLNGRHFSTVFGDIMLYLSGGRLVPGINRLTVSAVFGDINVTVPKEMAVFATGSDTFGDITIFGKVASGMANSLMQKTDNFDSVPDKLYIHARTVFGDVRIHQV